MVRVTIYVRRRIREDCVTAIGRVIAENAGHVSPEVNCLM